MFNQIFGKFLLEQKLISSEQLDAIQDNQKKTRGKLGLIAVSEKLLSQEQASKINRKQALEDKRFGDIAVEMCYLTESQVGRLLKLQGNPYLSFVQSATELGIMDIGQVEAAMDLYQRGNGFTNTDMEDFRSGDVDRMLPLYVRSQKQFSTELVGVAVRTIIRLIDSEILVEPSYEADRYEFENLAMQEVEGEHSILLGLAGEGNNLLAIAETFGREEFGKMDENAFDSVCEFINCVNGLYASELSLRNVQVDMVPPTFYQGGRVVAEDKLLIVPVYVKNRKVRIVIATDTGVKIEV